MLLTETNQVLSYDGSGKKQARPIRTAKPPDESRYRLYTPTKGEAEAIRGGRAAFKRGDSHNRT
jgi:hypothetical protein